MLRNNIFYCGVALTLVVADLVTTLVGLSLGAVEGNPLGFTILGILFRFSLFVPLFMFARAYKHDFAVTVLFATFIVWLGIVILNNAMVLTVVC